MIKKIYICSAFIITLLFMASSAYCVDWLYFIESGEGNRHYIDLESIKRSPEGIVGLKRKIEPKDVSTPAYIISDIEMDCEKVKIRKLSEKAYGQDGFTTSTMTNSEWQAIDPEGIDESLHELACSLKKKRKQ